MNLTFMQIANPMKKPATLLTVALAAACLLAWPNQARSFTPYTDSVAFSNAITSSNYTQTFDGLSPLSSPSSPTNFSGNGFAYSAQTGAGNFYVLNTASPDLWLSTFDVTSITFSNLSPTIFAIGGNFFATGFNTAYTNTPISVTITLSDASSFTTNYTPADPNSFFGVTALTNIATLTISNAPGAAEFMTVNNLTVAVPEPSTYALLALATVGLAGYVIRRRRA
jgi:hypothetical protein